MRSCLTASRHGLATVILFNKPYGVVCQFSAHEGRRTLADYISERDVYAAGRLDADSEGLVVLTADGALQHEISDPRHKLPKVYWAQVEGAVTQEALHALRNGVVLPDFTTRPAEVNEVSAPEWLWARDPPIRVRRAIPTAWLELKLIEGRNRQVRRMTAAVGLPTLRLVRYAVGAWKLDGLAPGVSRCVQVERAPHGARTRTRGAALE